MKRTAISLPPRNLLQRPARLNTIRTYYSQHHPDPHPFTPTQDKILSHALAHVPKHGFTEKALTLGAQDSGHLEVSVQLFPRGPYDLINYHLVTQRLALKDRVQFPTDTKLGVARKIQTLAWARLLANRDVIHQWQGALGHMSLLGNIPASIYELNLLADEMWFLAGDSAVDFSWYTKRASLSAVYASSEMFMTTDTSRDFVATEEFLDRRLRDALRVGGAVGGFTDYVGFWAGSGVHLARAWGMRV